MPRLPDARHKSVDCYKISVTRGLETKVAEILKSISTSVDPTKFPITDRWKCGDFRLSAGHDASYFTNLFNQQRDLYINRIQMSINGVPNDLLTSVPRCNGSNGMPNQLTFQQLMVSGYPIVSLNGTTPGLEISNPTLSILMSKK